MPSRQRASGARGAGAHVLPLLALALATLGLAARAAAQQVADSSFVPVVSRPAFAFKHPRVLFDEAHHNFHTTDGRYAPFVKLITADGFTVIPNRFPFAPRRLRGWDVLVIANALAPGTDADSVARPAFSLQECQVVERWVRNGGSLLLIADHAPFGAAAEVLSKEFGVDMGKGFTVDSLHTDVDSRNASVLLYTRGNGTLLATPITNGRDSTERVERVIAFTGQSLGIPAGSQPFLKLSDGAMDMPATLRTQHAAGVMPSGRSAAGRAQGLAMRHGKGHVVILGEAAMLSAQLVFFSNADGSPAEPYAMGMNRPGIDNQQLALNLMHWLVGLLD